MRPDPAFLRVETPEDLCEAAHLALMGHEVGFEPIPGGLHGFVRPLSLTLVRRVSDLKATLKIKKRAWCIRIEDTPEGIVAGLRELVSGKVFTGDLVIDLTGIPAGDRSEAVCTMLQGFAVLLSYRSGRSLVRTDIVDLLGWVGTLAPGRFTAQVPYGVEEWGHFVRGTNAVPHTRHNPPPAGSLDRTLIFHTKPTVEDIERVLAHVRMSGLRVGLVNGAAASKLAPWFRGVVAGCLMPNYGICPVIMADDSSEAALKEAAAIGYAATDNKLPEFLRPMWSHQRAALRLFAVSAPNMGRDERETVQRASYKLCEGISARQPICTPYEESPTEIQPGSGKRLLMRWDGFVAGSFSASKPSA